MLKTSLLATVTGFACAAAFAFGPKDSFRVRLTITNSCNVLAQAAPTTRSSPTTSKGSNPGAGNINVNCTRPAPHLVEVSPVKSISGDDSTASDTGASTVTVTF
ncbi:MAG: hypothetical protein EPN64_11095 [Burkholderiaceae bacterium]|nr:MAG: hypothetical protein EPN64_11095 [Burkholderiaceae bacterium]